MQPDLVLLQTMAPLFTEHTYSVLLLCAKDAVMIYIYMPDEDIVGIVAAITTFITQKNPAETSPTAVVVSAHEHLSSSTADSAV